MIDAIICDFDGVLTDNTVLVAEDGTESVRCSRADGLAFDALRALGIPCVIVSTEANGVVAARAEKLRVEVHQAVMDKSTVVSKLIRQRTWPPERTLYIGNDLNDLSAMQVCGISACPADAHPRVQEACDVVLRTSGGAGVMREIVESLIKADIVELLYPRSGEF